MLDEDPSLVLAWPEVFVMDEMSEVVDLYPTHFPWDPTSPSTRVRSLLGDRADETLLDRCYPVYGVIRRADFVACQPMGAFSGGDTVLLVELALRGPWRQVPDRLFYNRRHAASSVPGNTVDQIAAWMDPASRAGRSMPETRKLVGYVRAVLRTELPVREKVACLLVIAAWIPAHHRWRVIAGEFRIRLRVWRRETRAALTRKRGAVSQ